MNSINYHIILERHDDPKNINSPPEFDRSFALTKAKRLVDSLEIALNFRPILDDSIQDGTHYAEVNLWPVLASESHGTIRLSKFGDLATIIDENKIEHSKVGDVIQILQKNEFAYIPASILEKPYDGKIRGIKCWMTRYFHYP